MEKAEILPQLFREVVIPPEVAAEFEHLASGTPRFSGLSLPVWLRQQRCSHVPQRLLAESLDPGETAAIALALIRADAVLVDERRGHQVARELGLTPIGLISILRAKAAGLLPRLAPVLDTLRRDAQFWISDQLRDEVLRLAGEAN